MFGEKLSDNKARDERGDLFNIFATFLTLYFPPSLLLDLEEQHEVLFMTLLLITININNCRLDGLLDI